MSFIRYETDLHPNDYLDSIVHENPKKIFLDVGKTLYLKGFQYLGLWIYWAELEGLDTERFPNIWYDGFSRYW
jgi:hypothetical protein